MASAIPSHGDGEAGEPSRSGQVPPVEATSTTTSPSTNEAEPTTILVGLSGPSSSGKTTLARLLRSIFSVSVPPTSFPGSGSDDSQASPWTLSLFILHQDDFYLTDALVPVVTVSSDEFGTRDLQDWDCVESLDVPLFEATLRHVKAHGRLPEGSVSKEDQNAVGESGVSDDEVSEIRQRVQRWFGELAGAQGDREARPRGTPNQRTGPRSREVRICILDGFLLYPPPPPSLVASSSTSQPLSQLHQLSQSVLSPRLFLPSTRAQTLSRRLRRTGYVTLEGFWTDPPGYVEDVVWPNYARDHAWMYRGGDVDGEAVEFDEQALSEQGVEVCPGMGTWDMARMLDWAVERVRVAVEARVRAGDD